MTVIFEVLQPTNNYEDKILNYLVIHLIKKFVNLFFIISFVYLKVLFIFK